MESNPPIEQGQSYVVPEQVAGAAQFPPSQPPQTVVIKQPGRWFGRLGKWLLVGLVVSIMINLGQRAAYESYFLPSDTIQEKYHSLEKHAKQKIAVIRVEGPIMETEGFVKNQIDQVRKDEAVKAIVLRIDSPGGTITACDYLYHHVKNMVAEREIPLVVSMGSLCASGGYYMAMTVDDKEDRIYAEPTTWTGSIGVLIPHYNISELLEDWKIRDNTIASNQLKLLLSPTLKRSDEQQAVENEIVQAMVDDSFGRFKEVVRSGRPALEEDEETLEKVTTGQIFTCSQAKEFGLVDRIGFIEDAIDRAIELAALNKEDVRVVKYTRRIPGLLEVLAGSQARAFDAPRLGLDPLIELATPRAYYLCHGLPALLQQP